MDGADAVNEERQFLVGEDEDDYEEVRSFRSSESIDSQEGAEERQRHNNIMGNAHARTSHLEVHTTEDQMPHKGRHRGGLAAKAGIILVRSIILFGASANDRSIGHSQYLHCHTAICDVWYFIRDIRYFGAWAIYPGLW